MLTENEHKIIKGCIQGKIQYQKQLYLEYGPIIQGVCLRYAANADEAKDLFHDIIIFILTNFKDFPEITSLGGFIYTLSVNKAIDYYRKHFRYPVGSLDNYEELQATPVNFMPEILSKEKFLQFINELPGKSKFIINLLLIEDYPELEIAKITGEDINNIRVIISRAKSHLRKKIQNYLNHEEFEL